MVDPFTSLNFLLFVVKLIFRAFKKVKKCAKRLLNTAWKEDDRILKILNDYFQRNRIEPSSRFLNYLDFILEMSINRPACACPHPINDRVYASSGKDSTPDRRWLLM
jgi:hypothetical protein